MENLDSLRGESIPKNDPDNNVEQAENNEVDRASSVALYDIPQHDSQLDYEFENAFQRVKVGLDTILSTISRSTLVANPDTKLYGLQKSISTHVNFKPPTSRTIAFAGDSGAGKSSVLNSILDKEYLAHSDSDGKACTSVIMEFRNADESHPDPFTIETEIMEPESRSDLLRDFLTKYRLYYATTNSHHDDNADKTAPRKQADADPEEEADRKRQADSAKEALECLFNEGHYYVQRGFLTSNNDDNSFDDIHQSLVEEIDAKISRDWGPDSLMSSKGVDSLEDCKKILRCLGGNSSSASNTDWWPLIKIIRVYFKSEILATGLVLADSPGFRDMNFAREAVTSKYLCKCDGVFIVADINRCCSDKTINSIRNRCGRKASRLVCTRSDGACLSEAASKDGDLAKDLNAQLKKQAEDAKKVEHLRRSYERARKKRPTKEVPKEQIERHALELLNETYQLETQIKRDNFSSQKLLIATRNSGIREKLKQKYNDLDIFFVSNRIYWDHRKNISSQPGSANESSPEDSAATEDGSLEEDKQGETDSDDIDKQWVELSGIDDIRRHCQSIIINTRLAAISFHLTQDLPAFLWSVKLWLSGADGVQDIEAANEINQALELTKRRLREALGFRHSKPKDGHEQKVSLFRGCEQDLKTDFHQKVVQTIINERSKWESECLQRSAEWRKWTAATFLSFCRNYGDHSTRTVGTHCMNEELVSYLRDVIATPHREIREKVNGLRYLHREIDQLFGEVKNNIESCRLHSSASISTLLGSLEQKKQSLHEKTREALKTFGQEMNELFRRIQFGDDDSIIYDIMREYYRDACMIIGTGADSRRKDQLDALLKNDLCDDFRKEAKAQFRRIMFRCFKNLHSSGRRTCQQIVGDIDSVMAKEGKIAEAAQDPELTKDLNESVEVLEASMEHAIFHLRRLRNEPAEDTLTISSDESDVGIKMEMETEDPNGKATSSAVGGHQSTEPEGEDLEHCAKRPRLSQTTEANEASSTQLEMKSHSPLED